MSLYLEQFLDGLRGLPEELRKNLSELRENDAQCQSEAYEIEGNMKRLVKSWRTWSKEKRKKHYDQIKERFESARAIAEKKVQLASNTYEMVDKHIRRLDADSVRFHSDLHRRMIATNNVESEEEITPDRKRKSANKKDGKKNKTGVEVGKKRRKTADENSLLTPAVASAALIQRYSAPSTQMDMPVDPNEPTYCICHQVSYGEMVGCDNTECPIEWFHFQCVGLETKPKGKWFCPRCTELRRKKH